MLNVGNAWHNAIRNKGKQHFISLFQDGNFLTDEDVDSSGGIEFSEILNSDENLTFGRAVQSELQAHLFNYEHSLTQLNFTQSFSAWLGVTMKTDINNLWRDFHPSSTLAFDLRHELIISGIEDRMLVPLHKTHPITAYHYNKLITYNGVSYVTNAYANALICVEGNRHIMGGQCVLFVADKNYSIDAFLVYDDHLTPCNVDISDLLRAKLSRYGSDGTCISFCFNRCDIIEARYAYVDGFEPYRSLVMEDVEFRPLGVFIGQKPEKVRGQTIDLVAHDYMCKFEKPIVNFFSSISYPISLYGILRGLCSFCGVELESVDMASQFPNLSREFTSPVINDETVTCREVLAWIAEACGAYARMTRYGRCELVWLTSTRPFTIYESEMFSVSKCEYATPLIERIKVQSTSDDVGVIIPDSTESLTTYCIVNNPFLQGGSEAELRPWVQNLYNCVIKSEWSYVPTSCDCEGNWALQCGDIIRAESEGIIQLFPIFSQTIRWYGNAKATIETTGSITREEMSQSNRKKLSSGKQMYELVTSIDGLKSTVRRIETQQVHTYAQDTEPEQGATGDIWIDTTDNHIYRFDGETWVSYTIGSDIKTFAQDVAPTEGMSEGDLWIDTDGDNALYRYSGSEWVAYRDTHLDDIVSEHSSEISQTSSKIAALVNGTDSVGRVSNTSVEITASGVAIKSGGTFTVESENFEIDENGVMSAQEAYMSGQLYESGHPVLSKYDIVVSTNEPSDPHTNMVWIRPDTSESASTTFSRTIPWGTRFTMVGVSNALYTSLTGTATEQVGNTIRYVVKVPIYIRAYSGGVTGGLLHFEIMYTSGGAAILSFTQVVDINTNGSGNKIITMNLSGGEWVGEHDTLYVRMYVTSISGYHAYNVMSSSDKSASFTLECISASSSGATGWRDCAVFCYS